MAMHTYEIDVAEQSLGRVASRIAALLRGKHLASYQPHLAPGLKVLVKNIEQVKFTGLKLSQKKYYHYSGYPGGLKERKLSELWKKNPKQVFRQSVYRMLPQNKLRDKLIKNLIFS